MCVYAPTEHQPAGDAGAARRDTTVLSGASLVFNASNWNTNQPVTLGAAADADATNSTAVIRCSAPNIVPKDVTVTNQDTDVIVNLALASRGSTITGSNGAGWSNMIDGVTTGYTYQLY